MDPFAEARPDVLEVVAWKARDFRSQNSDIKSIDPRLCPFPTFPEPEGLLPLGGTLNGGHAFWLMEGRPDDWPLVLYPHSYFPIERHDMPLVDFLVLWLSGDLPDCFNGVGKHFVKRTDPVFRNGWRASSV